LSQLRVEDVSTVNDVSPNDRSFVNRVDSIVEKLVTRVHRANMLVAKRSGDP
jgi:hypothetical protein